MLLEFLSFLLSSVLRPSALANLRLQFESISISTFLQIPHKVSFESRWWRLAAVWIVGLAYTCNENIKMFLKLIRKLVRIYNTSDTENIIQKYIHVALNRKSPLLCFMLSALCVTLFYINIIWPNYKNKTLIMLQKNKSN